MDSEQLVSNPFQEMSSEALDLTKRASVTEKLTSVKNNVCENHFRLEDNRIELEKSVKMKQLQDDSSRLKYEKKLMDVNKKKNELEIKKRLEPERDFSYDNKQLKNSQDRLGIQTESFYIKKKMKYPIRGKTMKERNSTPLVCKARKLVRQGQHKAEDTERTHTAQTLSTGQPSASSMRQGRLWQRQTSQSAPLSQYSAGSNRVVQIQDDRMKPDDTKLPDINDKSHVVKPPGHVKFAFTDPSKPEVKQVVPEGLMRAHTFHYGQSHHRRRSSMWDDSSEDDGSLPEKVDLRALLFGNLSQAGTRDTPGTQTRLSCTDIASVKRNQMTKPVLTQEMLLEEGNQLRHKIDEFLSSLEPNEEDSEPESEGEEIVTKAQQQAAKASTMLNVFSKPREEVPLHFYISSEQENKDGAAGIFGETSRSASRASTRSKSAKTKINMWDFIRGTTEKGITRKLYTPSEVILQHMTGLMIGGKNRPVVPLNSASRALRHTPTFKMRKVVEELMANRTKFEQHEVEQLRSQMGNPKQRAQTASSSSSVHNRTASSARQTRLATGKQSMPQATHA